VKTVSPPRVVSLVPSISETLLAWGVAPAGVTRFCDVPGAARIGGTKNPDIAAIVGLAPDLVVMDREENRVEDHDALRAAGIPTHATHVRDLADVAPALHGLRLAVGLPPRLDPPRLDPRPGDPQPGVPQPGDPQPGVPQPGDPQPGDPQPGDPPVRTLTAWIPIWRRPWMCIGGATYGSSLLAAAGIDNVFAACADPYPHVGPAEASVEVPDVVLAPSEPYRFSERNRRELAEVAPVVFVDGRDLFWWGARTPAALERLRRLAARLPRR
jgi:ABC-type Fe3+-hydroxamate transport system substrate-binding protein